MVKLVQVIGAGTVAGLVGALGAACVLDGLPVEVWAVSPLAGIAGVWMGLLPAAPQSGGDA